MGTTAVVVAAACMACGMTLAVPGPRFTGLSVTSQRRRAEGRRARARGGTGVLLAVVGPALAVLLGGGRSWVVPVTLAAAAAAAVVAAERRRAAARSQVLATMECVDEAVTAIAAELAAGATPQRSLGSAARASPTLFAEAARQAQWGLDPAPALRSAAGHPGAGAVAELAAAWVVATSTGCHLTTVLDRVRSSVHEGVVVAREVQEQLAPVRATARVLAVLPLAGLGIGAALGVNVPLLLVTTTWGWLCLGAAAVLVASGLWVVERLARRAERP